MLEIPISNRSITLTIFHTTVYCAIEFFFIAKNYLESCDRRINVYHITTTWIVLSVHEKLPEREIK